MGFSQAVEVGTQSLWVAGNIQNIVKALSQFQRAFIETRSRWIDKDGGEIIAV